MVDYLSYERRTPLTASLKDVAATRRGFAMRDSRGARECVGTERCYFSLGCLLLFFVGARTDVIRLCGAPAFLFDFHDGHSGSLVRIGCRLGSRCHLLDQEQRLFVTEFITTGHAVETHLTVEIHPPLKAFRTVYIFVLGIKHLLSEPLFPLNKSHQQSLLSAKWKSNVEQLTWQIPAQT